MVASAPRSANRPDEWPSAELMSRAFHTADDVETSTGYQWPCGRKAGHCRKHALAIDYVKYTERSMSVPEHLYPFRSPLDRTALRDALNATGPLLWEVRDSIYYGVYLRTWHEGAGKLRIFGDGPQYVLDMGDEPIPSVVQEIETFIATQLIPVAQAAPDSSALDLLPFPAAPLDLYAGHSPRESSVKEANLWSALGESWKAADPTLTILAFQVGTPATFYSENPRQPSGHHFDMCGPNTTDIEIDLHSPELVARMLVRTPPGAADLRIIRSGKWAFFKNEGPAGFYRECPQLAALARKWGERLERDIEFRLRISTEPISSIKTPEQGGPIELFRIEGPADEPGRAAERPALGSASARDDVSAPPAAHGFWQRIRGLVRSRR